MFLTWILLHVIHRAKAFFQARFLVPSIIKFDGRIEAKFELKSNELAFALHVA